MASLLHHAHLWLNLKSSSPAQPQIRDPPPPNVAKSDRHTVADLQKGAVIPLSV